MDSLRHVPSPPPISALSRPVLEALLVELFGEVAALKQTVAEQREEIARPNIKPSGMDKGTAPSQPAQEAQRRFRGKITPRVKIEEEVIGIDAAPGSAFKGHEAFLVQDLVISASATR